MFLKRLSPRTLFSRTPSSSLSPYSIFMARWSSSSPSHLTDPHAHSRPDSDSRDVDVPVSVFWDFENLNVPSDVKTDRVFGAIEAALKSIGIRAPSHIFGFGDTSHITPDRQEALSFHSINLIHVSGDGKGSGTADRTLHLWLHSWVADNPPPSHILIITGDKDYAQMAHHLRMDNYNVLLATKNRVHSVLKSAASVEWKWDALVREKQNLRAKYNNQPPDNMWYTSYEVPLVDPLIATEIPAYSWNDKDRPRSADRKLSRDSLWIDVQTLLQTRFGFLLIAESKTRGNMARNMHKYGPLMVRSLSKKGVLRMVNDMITVKKWVVESFVGISSLGYPQYRYSLSFESPPSRL